jgi:energy-coupling factor transporter ATP-binding protein EcfA2
VPIPDPQTSDRRVRAWNHLLKSSIAIQLQSIRISDSNIFEDQTIDFGRVVALVGSHGSGKSALLHMIQAAFGETEIDHILPPFVSRGRPYGPVEYLTGEFEVTLVIGHGVIRKLVNIGASPKQRQAVWWPDEESRREPSLPEDWSPNYCSFESAFTPLLFLYQNTNKAPQDLDPEMLPPERVLALNQILGRDYTWIKRYSVEADDGYFAPFIEAGGHGFDTNSFTLSTGELWTHYLLWWIDRPTTTSLILIDEPEISLAERAHRPLMDEVCRAVLRTEKQLIIATHSTSMLSRFPLDAVRICAMQRGGKVRVIQPSNLVQLRDAVGVLGLEGPPSIVIFVEDQIAAEVLRSNLAIRRQRKNCSIDMPRAHAISSFIGRSVSDAIAASSMLTGLEHQYSLTALAHQLEIDYQVLLEGLVAAWLQRPEIALQREVLLNSIKAAIPGSLRI